MNKIYSSVLSVILLLSFASGTFADIKIRQRISMGDQSFETTRMIKGARQRTEQKSGTGGGAADYMAQVATIEQCDLRRTVQVNDRKKLYFIEPFADYSETPDNTSNQNPKSKIQNPNGGTVTITYIVTDTGERQTLFGLTARHLKIVQETEASPDSCGGASRSKMEIDGWFVDFSAEFNCPVDPQTPRSPMTKPDCRDRIVLKGSRTVKTGFLLNGTTGFYDANGKLTVSQTTETLELSRAPLAAALFDVPQGYRLVSSSDELYSMPDMNELLRQQKSRSDDDDENPNQEQPVQSNTSGKTVGVNVNLASGVKVDQSEIGLYIGTKLRENDFKTRAGATTGVDFVLTVEIGKVKESSAGKIGGIFGKVTGVETKSGKTEVEMTLTLTKAGSTIPVGQSRVAKKFDGTASEAVRAAIDEGMAEILSKLGN